MIIDPLLSLACSMHSKKGVYALLLGSGVSHSAGIPTGWEVTKDLIRKLAALNGENEINNPEEWYIQKYGKQPDYSEILEILAKTPTERNNLLRSYFEPSNDGDELLKRPTKAHMAIAKLIKEGYIRVIITTNFDRLLEKALAEIDVSPNIITNIDQLEGAMPLIHSECTIVKLHGDYLDTRIKNTEKELTEYSPQINDYLDRVFDEFGLIVCGWSGEWDVALRNSIYRIKNNRFSRYWLKKGDLCDAAQQIVDFKKFELIDITDADSFFADIKEKIDSLNDLTKRQHPLSIKLACSTLKRLLPDDMNIIKITDLIMDTAKELIKNINDLDWNIEPNYTLIKEKIEQIENISEPLIFLFSLGCYWGNENYESLWVNCFKYIYENTKETKYEVWQTLIDYPALLIMYTMIIACISSEKYALLYKVFNVKSKKGVQSPTPIYICVFPLKVIDRNHCNRALNVNQRYPLSERLFEFLEEPLSQILHGNEGYDALFDKSESFFAINHWYYNAINKISRATIEESWAPLGRYSYKLRGNLKNAYENEFSQKSEWAAVKLGFWDGSFANFAKCCEALEKWMEHNSF